MIRPELVKLPNFVKFKGIKNFSNEAVAELLDTMDALRQVKGEEKSTALTSIGIIQSYLNQYDDAKVSFYDSYSLDPSSIVYANYIQAIERSSKYGEAIKLTLDYLSKHPNNPYIFGLLAEMTKKYPTENSVNHLTYYRERVTLNDDQLDQLFDDFIQYTKQDLISLDRLKINADYYHNLMNIAAIIIKNIHVGSFGVETVEHFDMEQLTVRIKIEDLEYKYLNHINKMFDEEVIRQVESGQLAKEIYFDHLNKLIFSFNATKTQKAQGETVR